MPLRAVIWCAVSSQAQAGDDEISLPQQEKEAREYADAQGYKVIDVLRVPGFSRRESDVITALEDFAAQGIDAYHKLRKYWQEKAFDILIAYNHGRLGRSSTLHSWVVENTILSGAKIYLIQGGMVDADGLRFQIAMGGVAATSDVDRLVKARHHKMNQRASKGLPTSSGVIWSHKLLRNEKGVGVKMVVDETKRPMLNALGQLIIEGIPWKSIERELFARYGYGQDETHAYYSSKFYLLIMNPSFWGHSARHHRPAPGETAPFGAWIMEEGHPIPPGVLIYYNTHEAVWPVGDSLGDEVRAELRRRQVVEKKARFHTRKFSGLVICGVCLYNMGICNVHKNTAHFRCASRYNNRNGARQECEQTRMIAEHSVQVWMDRQLRRAIAHNDPQYLFSDSPDNSLDSQMETLRQQIATVEGRVRRAIQRQLDLDDTDPAHGIYEEEIKNGNQQLKALRANLDSLEQQALVSAAEKQHQRDAFEKLKSIDLDKFWLGNPQEINQLLHRLMGKRRMAVIDGQIVGTQDAPYMHRNRRVPWIKP